MTGDREQRPAAGPSAYRGLGETAAPFVGVAPVPIVAIGASAGGLEAIEHFFAAVDVPSPFAFVIAQHLSPDFKSLMVELLARRTQLQVYQVVDGMRPVANAIHLGPTGKTMTIEAGLLRLRGCDPRDFAHQPIDEFFVSLAADRGSEAIGIVLSGSGSDGSRGARAIRASGGRVLVQTPATARFASMPQATIEAGCSEEVLGPEAMASALLKPAKPLSTGAPARASPEPGGESVLSPALVDCLARAFGIDVAAYRNSTVQHRVHRRMMLRGFDQLDAYAAFVADDTDEQEALYQDLLIGGTGFFCDRDAFACLEREVVPGLAAALDAGRDVRVWVAGCATGEEAYTIAMLLLAHCQAPPEALPLKIFATDIHRRSLAIAGAGFYSEEAIANVPAAWRRRFLVPRGSGYQVIPTLRGVVVFSTHDLLRDQPFMRLHLVSCRHVLDHLEADAQARVVQGFANAIEPGGHLLLGSNEAIAAAAEPFDPIDATASLLRRRDTGAAPRHGNSAGPLAAEPAPTAGPGLAVAAAGAARGERRDHRLAMAQEHLLDRYVPASLLLDEADQVIHCFGNAGPWLKAPSGRASLDVLDMVVDALRAPLAAAISRVKQSGASVRLADNPAASSLQQLEVQPLLARADGRRCLLVSFDDKTTDADSQAPRAAALHAILKSVLDTCPEPLALTEAHNGKPLQLTAANPAFAAAAASAGLAAPLEGRPLTAILEGFVAGERPSPDTSAVSRTNPSTWTTKSGDRLVLEPQPTTQHHVAILRLSRCSTLSSAEPAA